MTHSKYFCGFRQYTTDSSKKSKTLKAKTLIQNFTFDMYSKEKLEKHKIHVTSCTGGAKIGLQLFLFKIIQKLTNHNARINTGFIYSQL